MKKILSLLSMLMITVTAFATSYTDKLTYKLTVFTALTKDLPAGELTIEPYGTSNYTVTAKGCDLSDFDAGNWDEIVCEDVAGTKDANGVTTITLDNPYAYRTSDNTSFSDTKLVVKFNGTKAYAHFEGKMKVMYVARAFEYTFGTDEGFDGGGSTGGGETGGEVAAPFEKVGFVGDGTNFNWSIPVNWDTQKIVMSIDPSTCTGACEDIIGLGQVATAWDNTLHLYRKPNGTLQGYFNVPGGSNNNTNPFDETNPIKVEVSKAQGFVVNGVVKIPASQMSALFALSTVNMGTGEGFNDKSRATYNYVKVVDKDWTEVPPVTVKDTKKFENVAYTTSMGGSGTATVTFTEMSDDTFPMTFVSDDLNVKAKNLTKGTDEKGRTTYTGTAKRTDVDVTFTVKAVVYGETTAQKLYMTMDNGSSFVVTVGEDPDYVAPVTYKNTLKVVRGTDTKTYENAEVSVLAKGENKYAVTIPSFTDMDQMEGTIGKLTFEATGVEENGTLKLTATSAATTQEGGSGWDNAGFTASMDATVTGETLAGTFTVVYPNDATNYTYTLYYGVEPPTTPEAPKDVTVVEKYQADGSGFSHTINVDWDKQKIVASIDFSNGGDDKDILAMTTGDSFAAFQTSTYRTMHWYCNQTAKQMSGFFAKDGAGNNNTDRMDVADCLAKFEISKAEGLKVNGEVKMPPTVLEELLTGAPIIIGSGESPKFSKAFYNYIKVVSLDWKEPTEPEVTVKDEKTFNEALYMQDQKVADATVVVKEMSDETINMSLKFGENEYTSTELTKGTDTKGRTTYTGKVANGTQTYDVAGVVYEKDNVARLYMTLKTSITTVVVGENPDAVTPEVTEVSNKTYTNNLRIFDGEEPVVENAEAQVNIIKYSDESYKITLKNVNMLNKTQDLVFTGMLSAPQPGGQDPLAEEGETTPAEPAMVLNATADEATATFLSATSATAVFNVIMNDEAETENDAFALTFAITAGEKTLGGEFNYEKTPDVEEYPINFDKTAKSTHNSRALNSFSLQQTGKDKQTESVYASKAAYEDHTSKVFTVEAGSELTASFDYTGEWMHSFVYIDFDNDGQFSYKEGQWDQTGTDLVAFSFYSLDSNPKNDASGYNSVGDELTGDARNTYVAPSFKAPAKAGEYRIRFKFDWNCILPGGSSTILEDGGGVWDATLKVVEPVVDGISTINVEAANGEAQLFTVDGVKLNKLQKGLNIVRTADGKVKKVLVK